MCSGRNGCGQPVRTLITEGGTIRHLEVNPHPDGNHTIVDRAGLIRAHTLTGPEMPAPDNTPAYRIHKCPPAPRPGPTCRGCGLPMPRDIAEKLDWHCHPCCEPEFLEQLTAQQLVAARAWEREARKAQRKASP